jgi:hypothetical protein
MKTQSTTTAKAPRKSSKDQARDAFLHNVGSARELLTLIRRHVEDHMGVDPDELHWGHVGDAGQLVEMLKEAARGCNLINEEE